MLLLLLLLLEGEVLKGESFIGEPTGDKEALMWGGSLGRDCGVLVLLILKGLLVGVEVIGGEGLNPTGDEVT